MLKYTEYRALLPVNGIGIEHLDDLHCVHMHMAREFSPLVGEVVMRLGSGEVKLSWFNGSIRIDMVDLA